MDKCRKKHSISRVWDYLWYQASTGGLGKYPSQIRGGILYTYQNQGYRLKMRSLRLLSCWSQLLSFFSALCQVNSVPLPSFFASTTLWVTYSPVSLSSSFLLARNVLDVFHLSLLGTILENLFKPSPSLNSSRIIQVDADLFFKKFLKNT